MEIAQTVATPPHQTQLYETIGAEFIGFTFAAILFGVINVQIFTYYQNSFHDARHLSFLIALLWSLHSFHFVLISHMLYHQLVPNFTNPDMIYEIVWSLPVVFAVTGASDFIIRLYYTQRLWILTKRDWLMTSGAVVLNAFSLVSSLLCAIKVGIYKSILQFKISPKWIPIAGLGAEVLADMWIAFSLCYVLNKDRSGFRATDTRLNTLIKYTINTGLLTGLCATCSLVSYAASPDSYVYMTFYFCLPELYFISLLGCLNARIRLRRRGLAVQELRSRSGTQRLPCIVNVESRAGTETGSFKATNLTEQSTEGNLSDNQKKQPLTVTVTTETSYHTDEPFARLTPES